jgi:hypothetical protein
MENKFYIYALLDPRKPGKFQYEKDDKKLEEIFEFEPYYIGKGGANGEGRPENHLDEAVKKVKKNNHKLNLIRCLIRENLEFKYIFLKEKITEKEAFDFEKLYIKIIGREDLGLGPLTNLTDGGQGASGCIFSEERRNQLSKTCNFRKNKGKTYEEIYGKEEGEKLKEKFHVLNSGENNAMFGYHKTDEEKAHQSNIMKERKINVGEKNGNYVKVSLEVQNEIIALYLNYKSPSFIKGMYYLSVTKIMKILKENNIKLRSLKESMKILKDSKEGRWKYLEVAENVRRDGL